MSDFPNHKHRCKRCRRILNSAVAGFCIFCISFSATLGHSEPVLVPEPVHVPEPSPHPSELHGRISNSNISGSSSGPSVDSGMPPFDGHSVAAQQAIINHHIKLREAAYIAATSGPTDAALLS